MFPWNARKEFSVHYAKKKKKKGGLILWQTHKIPEGKVQSSETHGKDRNVINTQTPFTDSNNRQHRKNDSEGSLGQEKLTLSRRDQVKEFLSKLDKHKSIGPDTMYPKVLRDLDYTMVRPLDSDWMITVTRRGAWGLEESKDHSYLQNG